ncbi:hypothetical protein RJ55_06002 [Drechmeria coniospora]|nr:hypothetical protein RJ55_06002 [Drechmeria coniospora]
MTKQLSSKTIVRLLLSISISCFVSNVLASDNNQDLITGTGIDGKTRRLDVNRLPDLYTGDFDDCHDGGSLVSVTKFDGAYYADNLTVLFHLDGATRISKERVLLRLTVEAYGKNRFNMTYDPCEANITTMCPIRGDVPIAAVAVLPVAPNQAPSIPPIALDIPDLEGFARLQIITSSTETQIACFQAVITNGNTFCHPKSVAATMALSTLFAVAATFWTAIYGVSIPRTQMHHSHSFSLLLLVDVFQSIFFSGALPLRWPSILPAWWSNFAWSAGIVANDGLVRSISSFTGTVTDVSEVGGAGSAPVNNGGGLARGVYSRSMADFSRRAMYDAGSPYHQPWRGSPRLPAMPMPGTWHGFGATLSLLNVPPPDAFLVSLTWLLILLAGVVLLVVLAKLMLDMLAKASLLKMDAFEFFRSHLAGYVASTLLRILLIAFFAITVLTMYQFSLRGPVGPTAVAAVVWVTMLLGLGGMAAYACHVQLRPTRLETGVDAVRFERRILMRTVPSIAFERGSRMGEDDATDGRRSSETLPCFRVRSKPGDPSKKTVEKDKSVMGRFGWLVARYCHTRWAFFAVHLAYLFVRACFIGGGIGTPPVQAFGLFSLEALALLGMIKVNPFESNWNTATAVWMLSTSKIVTACISIAFLPDFEVDRIAATWLGIMIIAVQGSLAVAALVLIVVGMVSTCMSRSRNRERCPEALDQTRSGCHEHVEAHANDPSASAEHEAAADEPMQSRFKVWGVRRVPKIGDEDEDENEGGNEKEYGGRPGPAGGTPSAASAAASARRNRRSNMASSRCSSGGITRAARVHSRSWNTRDLVLWDEEMNRGDASRHTCNRSLWLPHSSPPLPHSNGDSSGATMSPKRPPIHPLEELFEEPILNAAGEAISMSQVPSAGSEDRQVSWAGPSIPPTRSHRRTVRLMKG